MSVRAKTMTHMKRLLAVAAATGAAGAACTKEGSNDTIKADESKGKPVSTSTETPTAAPSPTPSDTATVVTPPTPPSAGYMVVDMLPPPAKCAGASGTIMPTAAWKSSSSGAMAIEVHLRKPTRPDVAYSTKTPPTAYAGTISATTVTGGEVIITLVPDTGATYAGLYVPLDCKAGSERLNVELDLSAAPGATPKSGTPVKVSLYDSY